MVMAIAGWISEPMPWSVSITSTPVILTTSPGQTPPPSGSSTRCWSAGTTSMCSSPPSSVLSARLIRPEYDDPLTMRPNEKSPSALKSICSPMVPTTVVHVLTILSRDGDQVEANTLLVGGHTPGLVCSHLDTAVQL